MTEEALVTRFEAPHECLHILPPAMRVLALMPQCVQLVREVATRLLWRRFQSYSVRLRVLMSRRAGCAWSAAALSQESAGVAASAANDLCKCESGTKMRESRCGSAFRECTEVFSNVASMNA